MSAAPMTDGEPESMLDHALAYAAMGWPVIPCWWSRGDGRCACGRPNDEKDHSPGKHPLGELVPRGLKDATMDPAVITDWWTRFPDANIAGITGPVSGIVVIDIDPAHGGNEGYASAVGELGRPGATLTAISGSGGEHFYYRSDDPDIRNSVSKLGTGIDVRTKGGYIMLPPSNHVSGGLYRWKDKAPEPELLAPLAPAWAAAAKDPNRGKDGKKKQPNDRRPVPESWRSVSVASSDRALRWLQTKAPICIEGQGGSSDCMTVMASLRVMGVATADEAIELCERSGWNARCEPPWDHDGAQGLRRKFDESEASIGEPRSEARPLPDAVDVLREARGGGLRRIMPHEAPPPKTTAGAANADGQSQTEENEPVVSQIRSVGRTETDESASYLADDADDGPDAAQWETSIADKFAAKHGCRLRHIPKLGMWRHYEDGIWTEHPDSLVFEKAKQEILPLARWFRGKGEAGGKVAQRLARATTTASVVTLSRGDPRIYAAHDTWDLDPWLLNTPKGAVDLRTGKLSAHRPEDMATHMAAYGPNKESPARWLAFLNWAMAGDQDMIGLLQRIAGLCLTGMTTEQKLFFFFGLGRNGKGVCVHTMAKVMGSYATGAAAETFMKRIGEKHSSDRARLDGPRLVTTGEVPKGCAWNESLIKEITGGDLITANLMRQNPYSFLPKLKLVMSGNNKPSLASVGEAMRARMVLVPFTVTIAESERDMNLEDKLLAEGPAILGWMIEGCLAWQTNGLQIPPSVKAACAAYFTEQDTIGDYIAERCKVEKNSRVLSTSLYADYAAWCGGRKEPPLIARELWSELQERIDGVRLGPRSNGHRCLDGMRLLMLEERLPPLVRPEATAVSDN